MSLKECILYDKLENGQVQCHLCAHECKIKPGNVGNCNVRLNKDGILRSLVYGRPTSISVDPIEKKPLYHFLPGTSILSVGTVGCNFRCSFCQNWTTSQVTRSLKNSLKMAERPIKDLEAEIEDLPLHNASPEDILSACKRKGLHEIAFTYNEPTIFAEYNLDIMKLGREEGHKFVYVSNGYQTEMSTQVIGEYVDAINIDLKSFNDSFYRKLCGGRLQPVLDSIQRWRNYAHVEVTTLVVEGENDGEDELKNIATFLGGISKDIVWHISAAHPAYEMKEIHRTSRSTLNKAVEAGKGAGLKYVYVGNVRADNSTFCPQCNAKLIDRENYYGKITKNFDPETGKCLKCSYSIAGVWK